MSRTVSLRKAHQIKKVLVGEIAQYTMKVRSFNAVSRRPSNIDVKALHELLRHKIANLIELKTQITLANVSIYSAIVELEETKSLIGFYEGLNTTEYEWQIDKANPTQRIEVPINLGITCTDVDEQVKLS